MNEFLTWEVLGTYAGATAFTALFTQFLKKGIDKYLSLPTQLISYLVSVVCLLLGLFFTGNLTASSGILSLFNAVLVSTASNGTYDAITRTLSGSGKK